MRVGGRMLLNCLGKERKKMGAVDYLSGFCTLNNTTKRKRKQFQTVEIKVKMDCDGCERRVKNAVRDMKGLKTLEVNRKQSKVTVDGHVDPNKVLKRIKNTGKKAEFWPYVPHELASYPYVSGVYDKKAPSGYVRDPFQTFPGSNSNHETYISLFSEDNVHACTVM